MRPFLFNGETVELTPVSPDRVIQGDIVLFWLSKDHLMLHRVIEVQKNEGGNVLILQGDAFCWPDGAIPAERVIGRAAAVLRGGKWTRLDAFPTALLARMWVAAIPLRRLFSRAARRIKQWVAPH